MKNQLVWCCLFRSQCDDSLFGWMEKCGGSFLKGVQTPIWINDHIILKGLHLNSTRLFSASNFACHLKNKGKKFQMDLTLRRVQELSDVSFAGNLRLIELFVKLWGFERQRKRNSWVLSYIFFGVFSSILNTEFNRKLRKKASQSLRNYIMLL